ncbi:DinB family protein [uncultured Arcticibacterium sp.]|uniref:DinB family protein n=1 Tax=uncultured Arcticibacterium sp. TaxID=2173042 RepID=UPI0030F7C1A1
MNKLEIKEDFQKTLDSVINDVDHLTKEQFYFQKNNKWSAAQNMAHLTLSAKIFRKALRAPKIALVLKFGFNLNEQRDSEWIERTYGNAEFPAVTGFEPRMHEISSLAYEMEQFLNVHQDVIILIDQTPEWQLSSLRLPQPVLGKLSIREMCLFFTFHIRHHQKAIRISIS